MSVKSIVKKMILTKTHNTDTLMCGFNYLFNKNIPIPVINPTITITKIIVV